MQHSALSVSVEPTPSALFNASVMFGRDIAQHLGFPSEEDARKWTKIISKKIVKQSLMD